MGVIPYNSFKEWTVDMDRIRANPNDAHLIQHVRSRVNLSSEDIQRQVYEHLMMMSFLTNPVGIGRILAKRHNKVVVVNTLQDPWFHV